MGMLADGMFFSHGLVDQQQRGNPWFHPCIKLIISWGSGHRWGGIPQGTTHSGGATWRREADHGRSAGLFSTKSAVLLLCVFLRWFWISLNDYPKEVLCVLNMTHLVGGLELTHIFIFFQRGWNHQPASILWSHIHLRGSSRRKRLLPCSTRSRPRAPRSSGPWPRATSFLVRCWAFRRISSRKLGIWWE